MKPPKSVTVLIDEQEKKHKALLFPKTVRWLDQDGQAYLIQVKPERRHLKTADYVLARWPKKCMVEKKGSIRELHNNLFTKDRSRQNRALDRLVSEAEYPVLLCDFGYQQAFQETDHVENPSRVVDRLFQVVRDRGLYLLWLSNPGSPAARRRVGEIVLRLMLTFDLCTPPTDQGEINRILGVLT